MHYSACSSLTELAARMLRDVVNCHCVTIGVPQTQVMVAYDGVHELIDIHLRANALNAGVSKSHRVTMSCNATGVRTIPSVFASSSFQMRRNILSETANGHAAPNDVRNSSKLSEPACRACCVSGDGPRVRHPKPASANIERA